jgi:hypothetical protein
MKRRCLPARSREPLHPGHRFGNVGLQFGVGVAPPDASDEQFPGETGAQPREPLREHRASETR